MQSLAHHFVPAADEVWRLQNDSDSECVSFREAVQGHTTPSETSLQGTYIMTPGGQLLAAQNSMDPHVIAQLLRDALARWKALPQRDREKRAVTKTEPGFRWESFYPQDGLVLLRTVRDLPKNHDPDTERDHRFNRDPVWFKATEARSLLPKELRVGVSATVPKELFLRIACFSLVDNVRGQTLPFHPSELAADSKLTVTVEHREGDRITVRFAGQSEAKNQGDWRYQKTYWRPEGKWPRRVETRISGRAIWDERRERFETFELVALGHREGKTLYNNRKTDSAAKPIGFVFQLAPASFRVAPTYINLYSWEFPGRPAGS